MSQPFKVVAVDVRLADDLKKFRPRLERELRARMRRTGEQTVGRMRGSLSALRTVGRPTGARAAVAGGLRATVTAGRDTQVTVEATAGHLRLPLAMRSWRHPVFGTRASVMQAGAGYFADGVGWAGGEAADQVGRAVDDAIREVG